MSVRTHIAFSDFYPSPHVVLLPDFQDPLALSAGTHTRYRFLSPLLNPVSALFTSGETFAFRGKLLPCGLNMQLVQEFFLLLQLIKYVRHHFFLLRLSGHATAHPFHVFQGTDCSGLCGTGRYSGSRLLRDNLTCSRVDGVPQPEVLQVFKHVRRVAGHGCSRR